MPTFFGTNAALAALKLGMQTVTNVRLGINNVYEEQLTSSKILNWSVGQKPDVAWYGVVFGNGTFVGMGLEPFLGGTSEANLRTKLYTSTDGMEWTLRYTFNKIVTTNYSLAYGMMLRNDGGTTAPVFAVIGDIYSTTAQSLVMAYSQDGITWTETSFNANGCPISTWASVGHIPLKLVARQEPDDNNIAASHPTWPGDLFAVPPNNGTSTPIAQAFNGNIFGICDFAAYDPETQNVTEIYPAWGTLISTPGGWLVQDHGGQWYFASTYMNWQKTSAPPFGTPLNTLLYQYGNNKTVAVETDTLSTSRVVATTTDGDTWDNLNANAVQLATTVRGLAFGGGLFVAVGNKHGAASNIFCSRDGNLWVPQTGSRATVKHNAIAYGNGRFVMLGDNTYVAEWDGTKIDYVLTTPAAPTNLIATADAAQVHLMWTAPTNNGGTAITNYVIQYSSNSGATWTTFNDGVSVATTTTVTGLTNGVPHLFRVAAVNSVGTGSYVTTQSATTPAELGGRFFAWGLTLNMFNFGAQMPKQPTQIGNLNWTSVGAGYFFAAAVREDGTLWATGSNAYGKLGDGTTTNRSNLVQIGEATDWAAVSCGWDFTVAIKTDGTLWGWGLKSRLGLGPAAVDDVVLSPTQISAAKWRSVSAGKFHTLAIRDTGTLWGWGVNSNGELGGGTTTPPYEAPTQIGTATWKQVSAGSDFSLAIRNDNTLWAWGDNTRGQLGDGTTTRRTAPVQINSSSFGVTNYWQQVSAGDKHSAGVLTTGELRVWGSNEQGALGLSGGGFETQPVNVSSIDAAADGKSWRSVSAGLNATHAVRSDGVLWAWGYNETGQLGDNTLLTKNYPVLISANDWDTVTSRFGTVVALTEPMPVINTPAAPQNLTGFVADLPSYQGDAQAFLFWDRQANNDGTLISTYSVDYSIDDGVSWTPHGTLSFSAGTSRHDTYIQNLIYGTTYKFRIAASNSAGTGPASQITLLAVPATTPPAPTNVTATASFRRVNVSWTAPANDGGAPITGYLVEYSLNNGSSWTTAAGFAASPPNISTATTVQFDEMPVGSLRFRVRAINRTETGVGTVSTASAAVTTTAITAPSAPASITTKAGNGEVEVSWPAPFSDGGAPITRYFLEYSANDGVDWVSGTNYITPDDVYHSATVIGLTNGVSYKFRVAAQNGELEISPWRTSFSSVTPNSTWPKASYAVSRSTTVSGVKISIPIAYQSGVEITNYVVEQTFDRGQSWTALSAVPTKVNTAYYEVLLPSVYFVGYSYAWRVRSKINSITGAASVATFTEQIADFCPSNVVAIAGRNRAVLSWTPPPSGYVVAPITDYIIQYSSNGGSTWLTATDDVETDNTAVVTGLTGGTTYVFRVAAKTSIATGLYSAVSNSITPASTAVAPTTPIAPTNLLASAGNANVSLQWTLPTNDGGAAITDYVIQYSSNNGSTWTTFSDGVSTATTATVTGLVNGTSYVFRVAAVNSVGTGAYSASSAAVTPAAPVIITPPAAPTSVVATAGNASVNLSWEAPTNNGGATITDYRIQYSGDNGSTWTTFNDSVSADRSVIVSGLTNGTTYLFRVAAINSEGVGAYTTTTISAVPAAAPAAPTDLAFTPDFQSGTLSWSAPANNNGSAITGYVVGLSVNGGVSFFDYPALDANVTSFFATSLITSVSYVFRVRAINAVGTGPAATITTSPLGSFPYNVVATLSGTQANLTWQFDTPAGVTITDYLVYFSSNDGVGWALFDDGVSTAKSATVSDLDPGTTYIFRVAAKSTNGTGNAGSYSNAVTTAPGLPEAPTTVQVTPGNALINLSWTAPASTGGSAITDYVIQYSSNDGSTWTTFSDGVSTATSATVTGLTNGTAYRFRVAAVNSVGTGPYSVASYAIVPFLVSVPGAPALDATAGNGEVLLAWSAVDNGNSSITDYVIQQRSILAGSPTAWSVVNDGIATDRSAVVAGLSNNVEYNFRVAAVNSAGTSPWSNIVSVEPYDPLQLQVPEPPALVVGSTELSSTPPATGTFNQQTFDVIYYPPKNANRYALTEYRITVTKDGGAAQPTSNDIVIPASNNYSLHNGLSQAKSLLLATNRFDPTNQPYERIEFAVRAVNSLGESFPAMLVFDFFPANNLPQTSSNALTPSFVAASTYFNVYVTFSNWWTLGYSRAAFLTAFPTLTVNLSGNDFVTTYRTEIFYTSQLLPTTTTNTPVYLLTDNYGPYTKIFGQMALNHANPSVPARIKTFGFERP